MLWLGLTLLVLIFCFGFVLLFGAPYLPTLDKQVSLALDMADLRPGETLLELGCGDGKVLIAAARRGWKAVGYELNPLLVLVCLWRTRHYRKLVKVRMQDFWTTDWPPAQAVFVFALQRRMQQLDTKLKDYEHKPLKVISFAFTMPDKKPVKQEAGLSLYRYE
jgi:16S rRNA A1518/A1519 N6-dimethyltransferase RsmA/KsgA/DIM1 with predicted DNA glycosylase/AP lyase activity